MDMLIALVGILGGQNEDLMSYIFKIKFKVGRCIYIFDYAYLIFKFNFNIQKLIYKFAELILINSIIFF